MAVEFGVICTNIPDGRKAADLVGSLMSAALGCEFAPALTEVEKDAWIVRWGGSSSHVVLLQKGLHEFGDSWYLNMEPGERGIELSLLFTVVVASAVAILCEGRVIDEMSLAGGGITSGGQLLAKLFVGQKRSASEVMVLLQQAHPGVY